MLNVAGTCKPLAIRYTGFASETTGAGRGNPWTIGGRAAAHAAIFSSARFCTPVFYGGPGEGQLRLGRFPMGRFSTPCRRARHPSRGNERRASIQTIGGRFMRQLQRAHAPGITCRSQTPNSAAVLEIVSATLRAAALAPTVDAALDTCGDALARVADLAHAEVRHG